MWMLQRVSAIPLALCVIVHLGMIVYAVRGGLSAAEILARTGGSVGFAVFYGVFVAAVAVHAPLGLRAILAEWAGLRGRGADLLVLAFAATLAVLGGRAVWAVVA